MLAPKRVKYRKKQKGRMRGKATRGNRVSFGEYGLQAQAACWITNRQIESARVAMTRHIKRGGKVWIRIFPDKPITSKPAETRMGKGKGNPEGWVAPVKPGRVMFEIDGVADSIAREALRLATRGGAEVLGRSDLGQLAPGKRADFALFPVDGLETAGAWDPVAALILCAPLRARDVWVEGHPVVQGGRIVSFDLDAALRRHGELARGLMG